ncbi:MAG: hypothetical protein FJW20_25595 [Acidimicrobiia bacterium]|nr:hypothetical protein [Acidimicrobiia bacterium]
MLTIAPRMPAARAFQDARVLPSRSRDLSISRQNGGGAGRPAPPKSFRLLDGAPVVPAEPYPPPA